MRAAADRFRRFPLLAMPSTFLNTVTLQLPLLMIVALYGATVGGHLVLAQRIIALPATLVAQAVGQAFLGETALLARTEPERLAPLFRRTMRMLAITAFVPVGAVAVLAPFAFPFAFGEQWFEAGVYTALLAPMYYMQFVTNPTGAVLDVLERQDLFLLREVLRLGALGIIFVGISQPGVPPAVAVAAVSAAGCVTYTLNGVLAWRVVQASARASGQAA
jgi:O-antigen/teichoic acid export membrane protein